MTTVQLPGEKVELGPKVKLGPGLSRDLGDDSVSVTETGILQQENGMAWMASAKKRYIPVKGDLVLGVVTHKHPEYYRVDINGPELATLSAMAFESATKRNRVTVALGDIIYGKVSVALPDLEPEIVCCNQRTGKSEGMGVLQFTEATNSIMVNIQAARKALSSECVFAKVLAKHAAFEWCVGLNGRVLVTTRHPKITSQICRVFPLITFLTNEQIEKLVSTVLAK